MTETEFKKLLWDSANKLRGAMSAAEYKFPVLGLVFLKYVSDIFEAQREVIRGRLADLPHTGGPLPVICRSGARSQKVAEYLFTRDDVLDDVRYPGLPSSPYGDLAEKYLSGASGVLTIDVKGGREAGVKFMDSLELISRQVHVADARSCVLHPASTTHRQVPDDQLESVGITPGLVRISVGLENADDLIADIEQALAKAAE